MNLVQSRRDFVKTAALLGAAASANSLAAATAAPTIPCPAIDTHIHFYDPTRTQGVPWPPKDLPVLYSPHLPGRFRALAAPLGVVGAVVIEASEWVEDNQWVLDLIQDEPMIVGFIGNLSPGQPEFPAQLERFAKRPLFRGLRLHQDQITRGSGQGTFQKDLQRLAERRLTVDVVGSAAMLPEVARLAKLAPHLRLVIDHLPFREGPPDPATMRRELKEVAAQPNVYAKISDVPRRAKDVPITDPQFYQPTLDTLCELFGEDRVVYGSNWPVSDLMAPYGTMRQIVGEYFNAKSRGVAEKFFWKNSLAAYSWLPRGEAGKLAGKS